MRKLLSGLCASALALSFAVSSSLPVSAGEINIPRPAAAQPDSQGVQTVQYRWRHGGHGHYRPGWHGPRPSYRHGWYRGHRGYRYYRPGYRYHDGWWFPGAAFLGGAIVGSMLAAPPPRRYYRGESAHVRWCYNRYRSYRAYDNTFQPYNGPRRQCISPYG
ncbi:BA14K-like protein [Pseudaminobacter salicylatoxidans]|uniref:Lectin-like protein BA14k n=1 Tax=Pseudaminobacter salicylatoxidans TaxID=93369 RepID=A0A316C8A6_PSESE|nr:BA14K family protein [Pseudaminobacter salicylatoxidans]PWJ85688.1 BA14K-like protein [Pseudaminobacter salicylatoxidans]